MAALAPDPASSGAEGGAGEDADGSAIVPAPRPRLPAAAAPASAVPAQERGGLGTLYLLTLLSAADGSLLLLAASGRLDSLGGAVLVGLLVVAGAGSWLAAHRAFAGRSRTARDWASLGLLAVATGAATVASAWLGLALGQAVTLHVLPKAAGVVLFLVAGEVAGLRLRVGRVPAPLAAVAAAGVLEVALRWTP